MGTVLLRHGVMWTLGSQLQDSNSPIGQLDSQREWLVEMVDRCHRYPVELDCDWHTINDALIAYGTPLVEDPNRFGKVRALGLDETLFCHEGRYRT